MTLPKQLAIAAREGDLSKMQQLINSDNELATTWQPIMEACLFGQVDALKILLENGADPNIKSRSSHHYRPLHRTVEHKKTMPKHEGHHQVVEILLRAGADPMMQGSSWLISAVALCGTGNSTEFIPALLAYTHQPLDIFHSSLLGDTTAVSGYLSKDPSLARAYHEGTRIWTNKDGWTPLLYCARSCMGRNDEKKTQDLAEVAQILLGYKADLTGCVEQAIYANNMPVFETLLKAGGGISDDDMLNHAACDGQFEVLELLLKYGTKLDGTRGTEHHGGCTPLGCAVSCRSLQGVQWFLEKGQDPNRIKSPTEENCLHVAVHYGASNKLIQLLLDYGADMNQKDSSGHTPLARAQEKNRAKAIALLEATAAATSGSRA